ncbi:MAG TPA: hypothetical protein VG779_13085 [Actinomycetota bacterium]|nr:hypothetical protein [Actinomycetota bacterium]
MEPQMIVHVSAEALAATGEGEHCEVEDGPEIAPETARRLACDAAVVGLVENASGEVVSMGRKTRKVSPAMAGRSGAGTGDACSRAADRPASCRATTSPTGRPGARPRSRTSPSSAGSTTT